MELKNFLSSLQRPARIGLAIGIVVVLALTGVALWWVMAPREQLLFGNLREADAAEIVASLDEWKVPHSIVDGGTGIKVAQDQVYATRMRLVSAGVPRGGHVGFELFDDSDFGVTEFAQRVNYQRALQGEIERTIASLPGVETARVHLTIRRPGLFADQNDTSKASVALSLRPGHELSRNQIEGVRSLVAAAVEGLSPTQVSVLDSDGALLAAAGDAEHNVDLSGRADDEMRLEQGIQARVTQLLGQVLKNEEFRVSVDATLNFDSVREINERPLAQGDDGNGLLSRKRVTTSGSADGNSRSQNQEESDFVHGTARQEISRAPGRIERLSVAVILPPTLDEMDVERIRSLIAAGAGIEPERGDRLEVSRVGRDERWMSARTAPIANAETVAAQPRGDAVIASVAAGPAWRGWAKWLGLCALGFLAGAIVVVATTGQRGPKALTVQERDAVLAKLRGWLAEGGTP
ncbi:MAG TPA: flagellar basal-body MS-ring/collar protein FliF [Lysobacter sp.]